MDYRKQVKSDPFGYRALLAIAIPLAATVGCFAITLFTDRTLLMWYGPVSSAASVSAGNLYWALVCIPVTAMGFVTPLVSLTLGKRRGRGAAASRVWSLIWQCVWLTVACSPLFVLLGLFSQSIFEIFGHPMELATEEATYFKTLLLIAPASMLEAGLTAFFIGRRVTKPILRANIASSILNVIFDVWFIFGAFGIPAMGVFGAALATAVSMWIKVFLFLYLLLRLKSFSRHLEIAWRPNFAMMREIIVPGSTLGIQQLIRSSLFSFILIAIGASSVVGLAATSAALSLYQLLSIPAIGLATAVTVLTSQAFAAGGIAAARQVVQKGLVVGGIMAGCLAFALLVAPTFLLQLSLGGLSVPERNEIQPLAITLLAYAAIYGIADVASLLMGASIKGLGKTAMILVATAISGTGTILIAWWFVPLQGAVVTYWWTALVVWSGFQASIVAVALTRLLYAPMLQTSIGRLALRNIALGNE